MDMNVKQALPLLSAILILISQQSALCQMLDNSDSGITNNPSSSISIDSDNSRQESHIITPPNTSESPSNDSQPEETRHRGYYPPPEANVSRITAAWAASKSASRAYYIPGDVKPPDQSEMMKDNPYFRPPTYSLSDGIETTPGVPVGGATTDENGHTSYIVYASSGVSRATRVMIADKTARGPSRETLNAGVRNTYDQEELPSELESADIINANHKDKPKKKKHTFRKVMRGLGFGLMLFNTVTPFGSFFGSGKKPCH